MTIGRLAMLGMLACVSTGCVAVGATSGRVSVQETAAPSAAASGTRFSDRDVQAIREYVRNNKKSAQDVARRGGKLPLGLVRGDKLPVGVGEPLPSLAQARLAPPPAGHTRLHVGPDVLLIDSKTRIVADILYGVIN